jgi:hypothetical protein
MSRRQPRGRSLKLRRGTERASAKASGRAAESRTVDTIALRVRAAGGPLDAASYSCSCGATFSADVSTTVSCPRCGAGQAW